MFSNDPMVLWHQVMAGCMALFQQGSVVHVPCHIPFVNVRSHPSLSSGRLLGTYGPGTVLQVYEERLDNPSPGTGAAPERWVRVSEYGGYNGQTLWVRRSDGFGTPLLQDGQPPLCPGQTPTLIAPGTGTPQFVPTFTPTPTPIPQAPGCNRPGTCLTGQESPEFQVAFVLACEAAAGGYTRFEDRIQAMTDIAHVIQSRILAGGFPDTAFDVIRQPGAFQCYAEGATNLIDEYIAQAAPIAETLVSGRGSLGPPSRPEFQSALFFFGLPWQRRAGTSAQSQLDPNEVIAQFVAEGIIPAGTPPGIYLGHGPFTTPSGEVPEEGTGFATFFFSDDPGFSGRIP